MFSAKQTDVTQDKVETPLKHWILHYSVEGTVVVAIAPKVWSTRTRNPDESRLMLYGMLWSAAGRPVWATRDRTR